MNSVTVGLRAQRDGWQDSRSALLFVLLFGGSGGSRLGTIQFTLEEKSSEVSFKDGETVLEALQREEVDAPFSCEGGFCGTCKAMVEEGAADMGDNDYLSEEELEEGWVLACQAQPKTEYLKLRFEE